MNNTPSTEERIWAVFSHLSAFAMGMGLLLPVIGWAEQRRKSKYASFQCLQSLGYQSLGYTVWMLSYLLLMIVLFLIMVLGIGVAGNNSEMMGTAMTAWMVFFFVVILISLGGYFLLPIIAAVSCGLGREFRYPVLGSRLARYLGYEPAQQDGEETWLIEEHEDRWVSSMGHFTVILPLWGILAPVTAWIVQGKRSLFLKFQSIQTTAYQVLVNGIYLGSGFIMMIGMSIFFALVGLEGGPSQPASPSQMIGIVVFALSMLIFMFVILVLPLFHILGQWAGYRVLKGDDYRYPLVGRLVENWMNKNTSLHVVEGLPDASE
ncbi:MAG: DUF4870 domain-containing protein [Anaerolineales bacterium]